MGIRYPILIAALILLGVALIVTMTLDEKPQISEWPSLAELKLSPWYDYFTKIYSDEQLNTMMLSEPLRLADLWIFQPNLYPSKLRSPPLLSNTPKDPTKYLSLFTDLDPHVQAEVSVIYQYQYHRLNGVDSEFKYALGMPDDSWVEVQRGADAQGAHTWFYFMKGSGNLLNVGRTIVFPEHQPAYDHFDIQIDDDGDVRQNLLALAASKAGYDSIQFTFRNEDNRIKYEIFYIKETQKAGTDPCVPGVLTRDNLPCACDPNLKYLNCKVGDYHLPNAS